MKDLVQIWGRVTGRQYQPTANTDRELRDLSNNRLKISDIDTSTFEVNFAECEVLNNRFNDDLDFNERKDAIINRLFERRRKGQLARQPKCLFILLLLGFIALGTGCFILFVKPYDFLFRQKVVLQDGGEIFEMWRKPEVDLYARIFLFNVTNAEAFMNGEDSTLKVKEVGPYVYKEALEHDILEFNDNGTISAIPRHPLSWVEELSEGHKEDDLLFLPNIALLSIANVVAKQSVFTRFGLNNLISLTKNKPLVKMTAREFMMGYKNELMTLGNTFMPGWIYFDKLGLIDRMYDFKGDYETIFTGDEDVRISGLIDTYKGSTDLPQWEGKHCSNVQYSSDGTKFKGGLSMNESVLFFRKSLCRAAPLIPKKQGVKSGLDALMYTFPDHMLDNGKHHEENKCFCRHGTCLPEGLIDVTDCYYGFPIALSYPHYYQGDEVLFDRIEGLTPNKELHETRFWLQPESGLPLDVSSKFQINMALGDISAITNTEKFANLYLPLLWFDIRMYALPQNLEDRFKLYLNILPVVEKASMYILLLTGSGLIILTIYMLTFKLMFKTFDGKKHFIRSDLWSDKEKCQKDVYAPCEVPLNSDSDEFDNDKVKSHVDKFKELSHKLTDKVYDSVGSVKDKVREFTHVKHIFKEDRKNSLIPKDDSTINDAYKSDSESDCKGYQEVRQSDSEDDCKYLEVLDDGTDLQSTVKYESDRAKRLRDLDSRSFNDEIVHISD